MITILDLMVTIRRKPGKLLRHSKKVLVAKKSNSQQKKLRKFMI